jgi:excisionase family DNA binding protein
VPELHYSDAELDRLADLLAERVAARVAARTPTARRALITVNDAAKELGCHPKTVRRRIEAGVLRAVREQDRVVIRADDLDDYIARLGRTGRAGHSPQRRTGRARKRDYDFLRGG